MNEYTARTVETIKWIECTEKRYDEMLGVLPPAIWLTHGFMVGEPVSGDETGLPTFSPFVRFNQKFYEGDGPMTRGEFKKLTPELVAKNISE